MDAYFPSVLEELDAESIRYELLETRNRPGVPLDKRHEHIAKYSLVLHLRAGWFPKPPVKGKNITQVYYGQPNSFGLADELGDAVGQWGSCWSFGHKTANPKLCKDNLLVVPETKAVTVEPFAVNGPDTGDFMRRMRELGTIIGRVVADHLKQRNQAMIGRGVHVI